MFATLMPVPKQQYDGIAGLPLVGGKIYTYAAGTTVPKATYSEADGSVAQANPIVLNVRGEPASPIFWSGAYYVEIFDALGNLIYTCDDYQPSVNQNELLDDTGAGMVGFDINGAYGVGTLGRWLVDFALSSGSAFVGFLQAGFGAILRSAQSKMRDTVSVHDFMSQALIDDALSGSLPVLDHTAAVQAAVNYCILKNRDLEVPGLCRLTASIMVDRYVDALPYYSYFTIRSNSGGGFYVDTAINMFSSTFVSATDPVSQLVRWEGLRFITNNGSLLAYVINGIKFLRCEFNKCNFEYMKCLVSTKYVQSIYLIGCNARRWDGTFFKCAPQGYDIQVIGGLYEASYGPGFDIASPIGGKFWTILEGIQGTALAINGAQGVDVSSYFETNTMDIDCRTGGLTNYGINLHGSYFSHANATYSVKWGVCYGCISHGNWHTFNMHDLQSDSFVDINDKAQGLLSNGDAVTHQGYREGLTSALNVRTAGSASYTTTGLTSKYTRMGNRMQIDFICTLTSTGVNAADQLYIPSLFPANAATPGMLCGSVEVSGSTVNNGIGPLYIASAVPLRVQTPINVVPANVAGASWVVRGQISYQVAV